jgi:hypothetical protein
MRQIHDVHAEAPFEGVVESAASVEVLVLDGSFLHRPELRHLWDLSVFLEVDVEVSIPRCDAEPALDRRATAVPRCMPAA